MTQPYKEVQPEDFMKIGGEQPPHLLIEKALINIGSSTGNGAVFKKEALKLAGWTGGSLTTYASRAHLAAEVLNRIRVALDGVENADELKKRLQNTH